MIMQNFSGNGPRRVADDHPWKSRRKAGEIKTPMLSPEERLEDKLTMRVTKADARQVRAIAAGLGMTPSEYMRIKFLTLMLQPAQQSEK